MPDTADTSLPVSDQVFTVQNDSMDAGHTNFFLHTECHRAFMQGAYSPGKNYGTNIKHEICTVVMDIFTAVTFLAEHPVVESHS